MNAPIKTTLHTGRFLALVKEGQWEYADRVNATGAALIVAVTPENKVLLVEQYRIPVHARTVELPAGIIGDEPGNTHESNAAAARRELQEETGYTADRTAPPAAALLPSARPCSARLDCGEPARAAAWPTRTSPSTKSRWAKSSPGWLPKQKLAS
jgi:8-oxo-dGTP pyrophosphatase MutT (NUDIX family)